MEALRETIKKIKKAMQMALPSFTTMSDKVVTIEVGSGDDIKRFSVHYELLVKSSNYFKAAFEGEFQEDFLLQFQHFLDWLYFGRLPGNTNLNDKELECLNCGKDCTSPEFTNPNYE